MLEDIVIRGAREHNLKNVDVNIPRNKLIAITGVSGSGKSSLAFDTIYAEGQRRYVESLSAYARQFLGLMEKPDVDYIEGLSPAISIDQKGPSHNPRSTVGTITEIYDYLRLLFARIGHPHCPQCGKLISRQTVQQIVDAVIALPAESKILILAPIIKDRKGEYRNIFENLQKSGFVRVRIDGEIKELSGQFNLDKNKKHSIDVVIDRLRLDDTDNLSRISDSVETALKIGSGVVIISVIGGKELLFSEHFACVNCGISLDEIEPRTFSFNNPHGACPTCSGLGTKLEIDPTLITPNKEISIGEAASIICGWGSRRADQLKDLARRFNFSVTTPVNKLKKEHLKLVLYGENKNQIKHKNRYDRVSSYFNGFEGVIPLMERLYRETQSNNVRTYIDRFMSSYPCADCGGRRLRPESLAVTIDSKNIIEVTELSAIEEHRWINFLMSEALSRSILTSNELLIAQQIFKEINTRLKFLIDIGLGYLTLNRASSTLSGGETQRIRLATQIGSGLMGVLYVCDEPTIGLHSADVFRLVETLKRLRNLGNTIVIVEHDEAMMRSVDYIIDMGPGAGELGGSIVASGSLQDIMLDSHSITGQYLSKRKEIPQPRYRRIGNSKSLIIKGAQENNLKNIDVTIPLGKFVCISGVSGSGKSTLINDVLYKYLAKIFYNTKEKPGICKGIEGIHNIDKVINIDQSPIGRTPRSNPATYSGTFTPIRELFSEVPESRARGYLPGRFSFNVKGGRCEACQGDGYIQIEMQFLPDVTVPCETCKGNRYNREALEILFKGKNIADILNMSVDEALIFFANIPKVKNKLQTLKDVGLGYIRLGQPAPTLSGGEAQRVKLSTELSRRSTGKTIYILDEPTTGLSFADIACLLEVLQRFVDSGNTVVIIEHHLDVIKNADHVIDLGPGAGDEGGFVIATGTPEEIASHDKSLTGKFLRKAIESSNIECSVAI